jgi:hypothetical protein
MGAMWWAVVALALAAPSPPSGAPVVVEKVLAVVGNAPVLASDVTLARDVQLLVRDPDEGEDHYRARLLDARIRLELQYRDLETSGVLYRLRLDTDTALRDLTERAGGADALSARLAEGGFTSEDLEQLALRLAAARAYTEERLRPAVSVSLEEIQQAYDRLVHDQLEPAGAPVPSLPEVQERLRAVLVERKLNDEIERWLDTARGRLGVTRFTR